MSDYEIHEDQILGEGGMGTVCRGRQISLDRPVAIKIIRNDLTDTPTYVERFRREAELLGQVIDGHVVQVFGAGEWKGRLFYAMEYIEGEDLASRLQRGQVFEIEDILRIAHGVGRALKAAWKYQIVHRDIKPSNILITSDYRVKVADFGLARSLARTPAHTMTIAGTAKYLSPEQGMGEPVDVRSDIYSLGVVLFELATRQAPFDGDSPTSLIYDHVHSQPPSVKDLCPEVRDDVAALIMKCLAKKPEHRFQDPDELLDAVGWIRAQIDPHAVDLPLLHRTTRISPPRRLPWLAAVAIGAPILVAAVAYASWSHFSDDSQQAEQHRKAIDLAIAVGSYEEALELAKKHFGRESREYLKANRADRSGKVEVWERRAQAESAKRNWKETVNAYVVMQEFADGERKELVTAGLTFFKQLVAGQEAEAAGQWERALGIYQSLHPPSQDLRDYLHEATLGVREALAKQKELEKAETRRRSGQLVQDALKLRSRAEWAPALDAARKARDLIKPSEPSPQLAALLRELDKAALAPEGFVFVPSGSFPMGADDGSKAEGPRHRTETGAYYIGMRAVTRGEYAKFLEDEKSRLHTDCDREEPARKDHTPENWTKDLPKNEPVTGVDWYDAVAYARWAKLRLPTETEWEKAAGYQSDVDWTRQYPWGDEPEPDAKDVSFFGVQGMGRGPVEWTQSNFQAYPGSTIAHPDFGKRFRVLRGGVVSSDYATADSRTSSRHRRLPTDRTGKVGFRCAKDVE